MSNSFSTFLQQIGANLDNDGHCEFSDGHVEPAQNMISLLTHYGFLAIEGPDSAKFLQGQTTTDITKVTDKQGQLGAYCTPKGRTISNFYIAKSNPETYLLRMRKSLVETTKATLTKYIVFSKAEQQDVSDQYIAIGLHGSAAQNTVNRCFNVSLSSRNDTAIVNNTIIIQLDTEGLYFECWLPTEQLSSLWPALSQDLTPQGSRSWDLLSIRRGQADTTADTSGMFIPQMLDYHTTGAVSFTKGCYTGQEIVARMHYKGQLKRRLYRIETDDNVKPGDALFRVESEKNVGTIVNSIKRDDGNTESLAVISIQDAESSTLLTPNSHKPATLLTLPESSQ
jgi:folate-binding protein YgfZ